MGLLYPTIKQNQAHEERVLNAYYKEILNDHICCLFLKLEVFVL